jgi:Zn finger protein HypA/HybF involved in hydrogenase expression
MNPKAESWLNVARHLHKGETIISCPFCHGDNLKISGEPRPDGKKVDVYVICPKCSEHTVFSGVDVEDFHQPQ